MNESVQCPRCNQGSVLTMKVHANGLILYVCDECEATWRNVQAIGPQGFVDYGTLMNELGLLPLWSQLEPQ
jgi:transcription elongation factor Elf1